MHNSDKTAKDVLGAAMLDYQNGNYSQDIKTFLRFDPNFEAFQDILPLPYLFRDFEAMPPLEQQALKLCRGTVLDIGCGAGSHSLVLQKKEMPVTGLDASLGAIETCQRRGLRKSVHSNIMAFSESRYDTLLLLMNGIGIAGTLENLDHLFCHFKLLLKPGGQILLDSSDIIYMFDQDDDLGYLPSAQDKYYGEVTFRMDYKKINGDPFAWLYLDFNTLQKIAHTHSFSCELVSEGAHYDYLARICPK